MVSTQVKMLKNYIDGRWVDSRSSESLNVLNPTTGQVIGRVPLSGPADVNMAVAAAERAFPAWREVPVVERARYLFKLRELMDAHRDDFIRTICCEEGKTWDDARGEVQRAIENVEVAAGMPSLMMGYGLEDIARGIDESVIRQPLGVFAAIVPFNFPLMVPCWFFPYAIACGNTYIIKPSEQVPMSMQMLFELIDQIGLPKGVLNLVNGAREAVNAIIESPAVKGISFVGSSNTARYVYTEGTKRGKRVQAGGGAKNFIVVMPDADIDSTVDGILGSAFGAAGERCLAGSVVVPVGPIADPLIERIVEAASKIRIGDPLDRVTGLGPLISPGHRQRVAQYVENALKEGATLRLDGRILTDELLASGCFFGPTIVDNVSPDSAIAREEVFGPVLTVLRAQNFEEAIRLVNSSAFGNAASIFTTNGYFARQFRHLVECGNIGVNVGVAAPMAFFPFGGMKQSFFGDLHAQGRDVINFFTERKVVIERWPKTEG